MFSLLLWIITNCSDYCITHLYCDQIDNIVILSNWMGNLYWLSLTQMRHHPDCDGFIAINKCWVFHILCIYFTIEGSTATTRQLHSFGKTILFRNIVKKEMIQCWVQVKYYTWFSIRVKNAIEFTAITI